MINNNTCFKSHPGKCIDLVLTNKKYSFKNSGTFETGLSDFHHLIFTTLKIQYQKLPPTKITYRNLNNYSKVQFEENLAFQLSQLSYTSYENLEAIISYELDKFAPRKTVVLRGNNKPHCDKQLRKAIMMRSRLKNRANKTRNPADIKNYKVQRNLVTKLNKNSKKMYFKGLESKTNSKPFWEKCKPYFSNSGTSTADNRVLLVEDSEIISDEMHIATVFNQYFNTITNSLNLHFWNNSVKVPKDPIEKIIDKFKNHPSILKIKIKNYKNSFSFRHVEPSEVSKVVKILNNNKKTSGNIPIRILKENINILLPHITDCINSSISDGIFPDALKLADISPIFKKGNETDKVNYRPISLLPAISKVYEKIIYIQLEEFMHDKFNKLLCGFRKQHSTQHALLNLLQNWQTNLDKNKVIGTILMDLSKAYDTLSHELLIAKLEAYGLTQSSLTLMRNYLSNRKHRVRIGGSYSNWLEVILGVPQGAILGPILFNIFINDLFEFIVNVNICNFADDNTIYVSDNKQNVVEENLKVASEVMLKWFKYNTISANPDKFQFMILGKNVTNIDHITIGNIDVPPSENVKLLGITIDKNLDFQKHINQLCRKANYKTFALRRIRQYIGVDTALTLYRSYIYSNFLYCPLIWMFSSKMNINKINRCHKRALRTVYDNFELDFNSLLAINSDITIHTRHLQFLMVEVYKALKALSPEFMHNLFETKETKYDLRKKSFNLTRSKFS